VLIGESICVDDGAGNFVSALPWSTSDGVTVTPKGFLDPATMQPLAGATAADPCDCPCLTCP
jgi:hypothetical protein